MITPKKAIAAIEENGILLVYPIDNRKEPPSLWSCFYPRSQMRWEWDESGDNRVSDLWRLREELSRSGKVVYAKWFRGRATFFAQDVFTGLVALLGSSCRDAVESLSFDARRILEILSADSPLSTKQIKRLAELQGKALESVYEKAMKELWSRLMIVGFGEIDDGAFPSLAIGSAPSLFENLWIRSREMSDDEAMRILSAKLPEDSPFIRQLKKLNPEATS